MSLLPDTPWLYDAEVIRVVDGDSVWLRLTKDFEIDFGFKIKQTVYGETEQNFRLSDINAAERRKPTLAAGEAAKQELIDLLAEGPIKAVTYKTGKYGRYLIDLYVLCDGEYICVNEVMLNSEFVVPYGEPIPESWKDDLG